MKRNRLLHRRHFIKTFTFATAYSSFLGKTWTDILAAEIKPLATSNVGILRLNLQDFPALLNESGSVRLALNPLRGGPPSGPVPDGQFYPVIINRAANNVFYALNSKCAHEGCAVDPFDASSNAVICPCHGSTYAIDGKRLSGPAPSGLTRYTVNFDGQDTVQVQIPSLGYSAIGSNVQGVGGGSPRFRLDFRAFRKVNYEVRFRESLDLAPAPIPFSTTPTGLVEETVFTAATTTNVSLFVERNSAAGFYSIAILVTEI
jgi:Rieske Fe-S protein